jgi:hypothetical protein
VLPRLEVEDVVDENAFLWSPVDEPFEPGVPPIVERDDLPVEDYVVLEGTNCLHNGWESFGEVTVIPTIEDRARLILFCDRPEPIPLNLEQPSLTIKGGRHEVRRS